MVAGGRSSISAMGREGIRPTAVRHGRIPDERQGPMPADEVRPGWEVSGRWRRATQRVIHAGTRLQPATEVPAEQSSNTDQAIRVSLESTFSSTHTHLVGQSVCPESRVPDVRQLGDTVAGAIRRQPVRLAEPRGRQSDAGLQERLGRGQSSGGW